MNVLMKFMFISVQERKGNISQLFTVFKMEWMELLLHRSIQTRNRQESLMMPLCSLKVKVVPWEEVAVARMGEGGEE